MMAVTSSGEKEAAIRLDTEPMRSARHYIDLGARAPLLHVLSYSGGLGSACDCHRWPERNEKQMLARTTPKGH